MPIPDDLGEADKVQSDVVGSVCRKIIVTEEPFEDNDPNAAEAFAGAELQSPFGQ